MREVTKIVKYTNQEAPCSHAPLLVCLLPQSHATTFVAMIAQSFPKMVTFAPNLAKFHITISG